MSTSSVRSDYYLPPDTLDEASGPPSQSGWVVPCTAGLSDGNSDVGSRLPGGDPVEDNQDWKLLLFYCSRPCNMPSSFLSHALQRVVSISRAARLKTRHGKNKALHVFRNFKTASASHQKV